MLPLKHLNPNCERSWAYLLLRNMIFRWYIIFTKEQRSKTSLNEKRDGDTVYTIQIVDINWSRMSWFHGKVSVHTTYMVALVKCDERSKIGARRRKIKKYLKLHSREKYQKVLGSTDPNQWEEEHVAVIEKVFPIIWSESSKSTKKSSQEKSTKKYWEVLISGRRSMSQ